MFENARDPAHWSLAEALSWHAERNPSRIFVQEVDGDALTFAAARERAARVAGYLSSLGVQPGDNVVVLLRNDIDFISVWMGLARLGAVAVLLNTGLTGMFLEHQLQDSGARVAVIDAAYVANVAAIAGRLTHLRTVAVAGGQAQDLSGLPFAETGALSDWRQAEPWTGAMPRPRDVAAIMYTSGTTGPSKGVLMPHAHCFLYGLGSIDNLGLGSDDRYYVSLPLYHANGLLMQVGGSLIAGATAIIRDGFSASQWLSDVRRYRATVTNTLGVTAPFVFARPETEHDRDHALRLILAAPNPHELAQIWRERFGIAEVVSGFGMTECNIPVWGRTGVPLAPGGAGLVYDRYFQVEIFDPETDVALPAGEIGEIVVRPLAPFGFMAGYHGLPDKTCEAWRNLWFHTGDAGWKDADGVVFFADRIRDCIRRRGHNISSFEIECAFLSLDGVAEVAAFAVPADVAGGEDEVMVSVVPAEGACLACAEIVARVDKDLPRFAQPRYVEIVAELPKTQTGKIQKTELRKRGVPAGAWDRHAAEPDEPAAAEPKTGRI